MSKLDDPSHTYIEHDSEGAGFDAAADAIAICFCFPNTAGKQASMLG
jgi:hypothetical protein